MADLIDLIDREIPEGKKQLQESTDNLLNVAAYCEDNYLKVMFQVQCDANSFILLYEIKNACLCVRFEILCQLSISGQM